MTSGSLPLPFIINEAKLHLKLFHHDNLCMIRSLSVAMIGPFCYFGGVPYLSTFSPRGFQGGLLSEAHNPWDYNNN